MLGSFDEIQGSFVEIEGSFAEMYGCCDTMRCRALATQEAYIDSTKEPNISAKEPYFSAKEPHISAKEAYMDVICVATL